MPVVSKLSPDDYKGWAQSIEKAGYATGGKYAENLQKIIEQNGLQQYDRQVMQEMAAQGRQFGVEHNPLQTSEGAEHGTGYSFPVEREEFLFITSPFGTRQDPLDGTKQQMHKGVDIRCKSRRGTGYGKRRQGRGGKPEQEYTRRQVADGGICPDGRQQGTMYLYAPQGDFRQGRRYGTGRRTAWHIGQYGDTDDRGASAFRCEEYLCRRTKRDIDPAAYLAEIAQKGHIKLQMLHNGNDLLAKYKAAEETVPEKNLSPDGWMKKLLSSEDSGVGMSGCNDLIVEMAMTAFASLMLLATD